MNQQKIPRQLQFNRVSPKGFPSYFKQWQIDPMSNHTTWSNNDVVRFLFMNMGQGVFDPMRSYIQLTVNCQTKDLPVGLLQMDNSAQSFILQTVLTSNNRQIQRIRNYSTIAAYLTDMGMTQIAAQGRQPQGLGSCSFDTMPYNKSLNNSNQSLRRQNNDGDPSFTYSVGNIFPTIGNGYPQQVRLSWANSIYNCSKVSKGHVTSANVALTGVDWNGGDFHNQKDKKAVQAAMDYQGYANNIRAQYNTSFISNKYIQGTDSIPCFQLQVDRDVSGGKFPFKFSPQDPKPYNTVVRQNYTDSLHYSHDYNQNTHAITCSNFGFTNLFSPAFSKGTFQPFISPTVPQGMMDRGRISRTKFPIKSRTFKIPLISGIMGILIPASQYTLLPLQTIKDLLLQITLDPYAMFTSGYNDYCQYDNIGVNVQQKRCYQITRIKYKMHTYHYLNETVNDYLKTSMYKQIVFNSVFWGLGNQYQIAGGNIPNNTYPVGAVVDALNQLVAIFTPNDYQVYSFCRKHFRLSNNVTKFYAKIGMQYWPPQPYKGIGGVPTSGQLYGDNSIFVQNLYWNNDHMFRTSQAAPRINTYNFSPNQRAFDPRNRNTFYDPQSSQNHDYAFSSKSVNADTALGMAWLHQNRYVGKAAYLIAFDPICSDSQVLQGISTIGVNNLDLVFQCEDKNTFPRDQTLSIFYKASNVVIMGKNGIYLAGKS